MTADQFRTVTQTIEEGIEGDGYTVNIFMSSGDTWEDFAFRELPNNLIELSRDGFPPAYVSIDAIVAIGLCS